MNKNLIKLAFYCSLINWKIVLILNLISYYLENNQLRGCLFILEATMLIVFIPIIYLIRNYPGTKNPYYQDRVFLGPFFKDLPNLIKLMIAINLICVILFIILSLKSHKINEGKVLFNNDTLFSLILLQFNLVSFIVTLKLKNE
jgi:hypothetical protein